MLSNEDIAQAFKWLLNREPESEAVIDYFKSFSTLEEVRNHIMLSDEFFNEVRSNGKLARESTWVCRDLVKDLGFRIWGNLYDKGVSLPALFGEYEPIETRLIRALLSPGDHFLDIGGNIGWFTLNAADRVGASGRVVTFEPSPYIFPWLTQSVQDSGFSAIVELHRLAVGSASGFLLLDRSELSQNPGGASARAMNTLKTADDHHLVRSIRGDDILADFSPHLVKIDVEGAEMSAFLGLRNLLDRARPIILCEINPFALESVSGCSPRVLLDYFAEMEYDVMSIDGNVLQTVSAEIVMSWTKPWFNVVFAPREMSAVYTEMSF